MKITMQLSFDHYERLMKYAGEDSPAYRTLKNGVKAPLADDGEQSQVIVILCDADQAEMIRESAKHFCPEAVPQIEKWIRVARFDVP
jgi:hypothetical protein